VSQEQLNDWLDDADRSRKEANARYLLAGRKLNHDQAAAEKGTTKFSRVQWQAEQGRAVGRSARAIQLYMQIAKALDALLADPNVPDEVPLSILDRPLPDVCRQGHQYAA